MLQVQSFLSFNPLLIIYKKIKLHHLQRETLNPEAFSMGLGVGTTNKNVPRQRYDAFLSFRGEDTRKGFTNPLYFKLQQRGLAAFIDNERLHKGEVISQGLIQAIEASLVSIVILSQNYGSSTWCLDELQKIVELRKEHGRQIFPVFYGVDPADVRHQRGSFEIAFAKHEERFKGDREKVRRWRDALTEVANMSGWSSKEYRHDAELIESIVEAVWVNLRPRIPSTFVMMEDVDSKIDDLDKQVRTGLDKYYNNKKIKCCCFTF